MAATVSTARSVELAAARRRAPSSFGASRRRRAALLVASALLLVLAVVLSLALGSRTLPSSDVFRALTANDGSETAAIVRELRLPRTVLGVVVGAALGVAGAQLQAITRNPLADPGLLGVSAGAALAVVAASALLGLGAGPLRTAAAVLGAALAAAAVYALAVSTRGGASPLGLALSGVALTALLTSATTVLVLLDADTLDEYRFWVVGSLAARDLALLGSVALPLLVGGLLALVSTRALDQLALGDDVARGLGVRVGRARAGVALSATLMTAAAVAVAGPLAFVGLVVPHLARGLVGPVHRWLLPVAALLGATLLLASDTLGRLVARPAEVQAGVVTALVGAPFLLLLVRRGRVAQ
jgi:iron complex transport system permease protein